MQSKDKKIEELLVRGVEQIVIRQHLETALRSGRKLRVKLGIDPTSPDLHLGHAVVLRKLREFQDLGHKAILIIGDFTAQIGDPSGRSEARPPLNGQQVRYNMKKYLKAAGKIIDVKKVEVHHNSQWHKRGLMELLQLAGVATVNQVLKREDFAKRLKQDAEISLLETLYPLLQGYDSVAVRADIELGGTDQTFNVLMGRKVQRHFRMPEQDILTVPLLEGLDGVKKMSKSVGNVINLEDDPGDMFGKVMSLPDSLIIRYFTLVTGVASDTIETYETELRKGTNPKVIKEKLAHAIIEQYHGAVQAKKAAEKFEKLFSKKETPVDLPALKLLGKSMSNIDVVVLSGIVKSRGEARRLIIQGAFSINGTAKKDPNGLFSGKQNDFVKIGKHTFFRIKE